MKTQDRTIRDVKIGDVVIYNNKIEYFVIDIGKYGYIDTNKYYYTFEESEKAGIELKQPEKKGGKGNPGVHIQGCPGCEYGYIEHKHNKQPEKQEIEIAEELSVLSNDSCDIHQNRNLIIDLQETVNKLLKE